MMIHRTIGLAALAAYLYIWLHRSTYFPYLVEIGNSKHLSIRADDGYIYIIMLPLIGIACLVMPGTFRELFSPKYGDWQHYLLTPGFFVIIGYFCILVSLGIWFFLLRSWP